MKKLLLTSFLVLAVSYLFAQEQGDMVISGSLSWTSKSTKDKVGSKSEVTKGDRNFSFIPQFHYFIADKLSVGLGIGYSFTKSPNGDLDKNGDQLFNKLGMFVMQPMANYYISLSEKFYYVPRFYIGFGVGKYKKELGDNKTEDTNVNAFNIGLSLVKFEFKPSDQIGISFSAGDLSYMTSTTKVDDDNKSTARTLGLNFNLNAEIGFNYYF